MKFFWRLLKGGIFTLVSYELNLERISSDPSPLQYFNYIEVWPGLPIFTLTWFDWQQCGTEAAFVFGSSTLTEDQNSNSGWSNSSSRYGNRWAHSEYHQARIPWLYCSNHCTSTEHCYRLWQVRKWRTLMNWQLLFCSFWKWSHQVSNWSFLKEKRYE